MQAYYPKMDMEQIASQVNDISKAGLKEEWQFGKPPYSHVHPAPLVCLWSSYFATAHLLIRPDATRQVLLNSIWHPHERAPMQVAWAGSEEATVQLEEPEADGTNAGMKRHTGKYV